jgi:formylglycine-generating enzyme required for sulfatase activity
VGEGEVHLLQRILKMNVVTTAMVQIPKGVLTYGLPECPPNGNIHWRWHSGRKVEVAAFQLGKYAVTNAEYREYVKATGAPAPSHIDKAGFNDDKQPVGGISWDDARGYCKWLSAQTGKAFRLPSDAEWEYAARGGKEGTRFSWGESLDPRQACFGGTAAPVPVGMTNTKTAATESRPRTTRPANPPPTTASCAAGRI